MREFESSHSGQPVRRLEILPSAIPEMPANGGLLRIGGWSLDSGFGRFRLGLADILRRIFEIFPFSGDSDRRPGSSRTAWRALESWEPATRAAAREIACQQPAESSGGRGSRRGERWYDCGSLADLIGGPLQTLRTNGRTPRGPLLKSRAKGVFRGGRMPCARCARARPRPSNHPSRPAHRRRGRARSG